MKITEASNNFCVRENVGKAAILRSSDYGKTFAVTDVSAQFKTNGNGMGRQNGEKLIVDPGSSNVLAVRGNAMERAVQKHRLRPDPAPTVRLECHDDTQRDRHQLCHARSGQRSRWCGTAAVGGGVALWFGGPELYRSDDAGTTFSAVAGAPTALMPQRAAFDGGGNLYVTYLAAKCSPTATWAPPS
jgi:xyloglucan-specific exo-beta-1,4-glucanase